MNEHLPSTASGWDVAAVAGMTPVPSTSALTRSLATILADLFPADPPGLCAQTRLHAEGQVAYLREHPLTAVGTAQRVGRQRQATQSDARTESAYAEHVAKAAKGRKGAGTTTTYDRLRWHKMIDAEVLDEVEGSPFETVACLRLLAKDSDAARQRHLLDTWRNPPAKPAGGSIWRGDRVNGIIDNRTRFFVPDIIDSDGRFVVPSVDFRRGDSKRALPRLFNAGRRFDLVACDPPYNIGRVDSDGVGIKGDEKDAPTARWAVPLSLRLLHSDRFGYYAASAAVRPRMVWTNALLDNADRVEEIVWDKRQGSALGDASGTFNLQTERLLVAHNGSPKLRPHTVDGRLVQRDNDLWSIPSPRGKGFGDEHPSRKPPELFERIYTNASDEADAVLDPFAGCAPSGVAAITMRRRWLGLEFEQRWFEDGVAWLKHTLAACHPGIFGA